MRVMVPSDGPESWRSLLADPEKQWRDRYSAKELALSWESAGGFPPEVASLFEASDLPQLQSTEPFIAMPEYKVALPGGDAASQNDILVVAAGRGELIVVAVEGKASESFGEPLGKWLQNASPGKLERLHYLKGVLGLKGELPHEIRYQLLHRAASPVIEARRFGAHIAVLLVHCFADDEPASYADYEAFLRLWGVDPNPRHLVRVASLDGVHLYAGWAKARTVSRTPSV